MQAKCHDLHQNPFDTIDGIESENCKHNKVFPIKIVKKFSVNFAFTYHNSDGIFIKVLNTNKVNIERSLLSLLNPKVFFQHSCG